MLLFQTKCTIKSLLSPWTLQSHSTLNIGLQEINKHYIEKVLMWFSMIEFFLISHDEEQSSSDCMRFGFILKLLTSSAIKQFMIVIYFIWVVKVKGQSVWECYYTILSLSVSAWWRLKGFQFPTDPALSHLAMTILWNRNFERTFI